MKINRNNKEDNNNSRKRWGTKLLLIVLAAVLILALFVYDTVKEDPNELLKRVAKPLTENNTVEVKYKHRPGETGIFRKNRIPLYSFAPEESGEYTFAFTDIVSEYDVYLSLQVSDSHFNNYLNVNNMDDRSDSFSGTVFLNEGNVCYVLIEPFSESGREEYIGSFALTVTKGSEEAGPAEITETENAVIKVKGDSQTSVLFVPEESGYFRFKSRVISRDRTASTSISSVRATDNSEIKRAEGICRLEGGKEYYVWVSAQDLSRPAVKAEVSCSRIDYLSADKPGEYSIAGDTIMEFSPKETKDLVIYSVSDGDTRCYVYDSNGFPLNSDDDSGGELSGNDKDFALVIQAVKKSVYRIYAEGKFNECKIVITEYTGDGQSIGKDSIPAEPEDEKEAEED